MKRRRLNGKALLILVVTAVVLGGGTALGHSWQVKRNATAVAEQARQAEREGDKAQTAYYLRQYISLEPTDTDARARYGLLLKDTAKTWPEIQQAWLTLEDVLRRDPSRDNVRRAAAETAVRLGQFSEVRESLTTLRAKAPDDPELLLLLGRCELHDRKLDEAAQCFIKVGQLAPGRVDLCMAAAELLRRGVRRPAEADVVIGQMVTATPASLAVRLAAARYFVRSGDWAKADEHARYATDTLKAQTPELALLAADVAMNLTPPQPDRARAVLESGLKKYPDEMHLRQLLARLELNAGRKDKALEVATPIPAAAPMSVREMSAQAALMIDLDRPADAEELIRKVEAARDPSAAATAGCLKGQLFVRRKAWGDARLVLEKVVVAARSEPDLFRRVNLLLAECYAQQGNTDRMVAAYRNVLAIDSKATAARRGMAAGLAAIGKTDEAIVMYRTLAVEFPDVRPDLALALLIRNRRVPPAQQDWAEFDDLLKAMSAEQRATPAVERLQIDALVARNQRDAARRLVEVIRDHDPKQVGPWLMLVGFAGADKSADAVPNLLAEAERKAGWHVEWELVRVDQALRLASASKVPADQTIARLKSIEAAVGRCSEADKARLLGSLASAAQSVGDRANARRLWRQAIDVAAEKQTLRFALFELMLSEGDAAAAAGVRDEIRRTEGPDGPVGNYCEAACLAVAARTDRNALSGARSALAKAAEQRPSWSRVALLDADLCELEGQRDKALEKYIEAMDHGDDRLFVLRRAAQLLYEQHRYAEAHALLGKVPEPALVRTDLGRIAADLYVASLDEAGVDAGAAKARALQLARQAVTADSKDYRSLLWLGQLADRAGERAEAERAFRRAVEVADTVPDTWAGLILFLVRTDPKKVEAELDRAKLKVPKNKLPLLLAPCYEALGRAEPAEEQYRAILAAYPADPIVLRAVATFYSRTGQAAKAVSVLEKLTDPQTKAPPATVAWGRRALALSLPAIGNYQQFKKAVALIDANAAGGPPAPEDRLTKALLMAYQPAHRRDAIRLFESMPVGKSALPADAEFMLAQLYEADGDWTKSRAHLQALVNDHDKNPVYLTGLIRGLLRHDAAVDARPLIVQLVTLRPDAAETAELKARVLKADGRATEAVDVILAFAVAHKGPALIMAADLLQEFGQSAEAEPLYREFAATAGRPDGVLPLAVFFGRTAHTTEGLAICEQAWQTCPPISVARACLTIVRHGSLTQAQRQKVETWLQAAIAKNPKLLGLRVMLADLYDVSGRSDEAVAQYRRILDEAPENLIALNNLAFVLALQGGHSDESLEMINRAIDLAGPLPEFLDTRAVIHLKAQRADEAIKDLQQALAQTPMPSGYYHLAAAQLAAKNRSAAGDAFHKATAAKLKATDLHPLEQADFRALTGELRFD